jgi:hypothetical protein
VKYQKDFMTRWYLYCSQEPPASVKEDSLDVLAKVDNKMETEEEGASEKSSDPTPEVSYADKEISQKTKGEDLAIETANGSKSHASSEETSVEHCAEKETVIKETNLPSTDEDKDVLSEKLSNSDIKSFTDMNEEKFPKEDILIQDDTCPHNDELIPEENNTVICDKKVMDHQNVTEDSAESSNGIRKQRRGHPKNPAVEEICETNKHKNKGPCGTSAFNKMDLNNELESLAESFSDNEIFKKKISKLARRHKKKLQPKDTSVNGLGEDLVKKEMDETSRISSDVSNDLGFKGDDIHFEEQCGGNGGLEEKTTEAEKEGVNIMEDMPLEEVQADSSTNMQKMCNETRSSPSDIVASNGIEASSVLILPVES